MYTFAVLIKGVGGPITVHLEVERAGGPYDRAVKGPDTVMPEGKWTDLHVSFKCDKPFPEGWQVYVSLRAGRRPFQGRHVPVLRRGLRRRGSLSPKRRPRDPGRR